MKIRTLTDDIHYPGYMQFLWDGRSDSGQEVQPGLYICHVKTPGFTGSCRIIKLK
jgi:flagellar hook assembly protein FlgD